MNNEKLKIGDTIIEIESEYTQYDNFHEHTFLRILYGDTRAVVGMNRDEVVNLIAMLVRSL